MATAKSIPKPVERPNSGPAASNSDNIGLAVYEKLRVKAIGHDFLPGERLNEVELAREFGVSRTPLREALNRLTTEGFLRSIPGKGFFFRELDPKEIFDLYELRAAIEVAAVRLAVQRASTEDVNALAKMVEDASAQEDCEVSDLIAADEAFHSRLIALAGNSEMSRVVLNINARIQFVRWINVDKLSKRATHKDHRAVIQALRQRDAEACAGLLQKHISRRLDEIIEATHRRIAQIYTERASLMRS
ncbi:GntR family transcriptional regulator [Ramlibacter henchirensis]|uniref:GntR family transcriptional regulator n=1 Tax=Ramlibacter henchirensis TaxID=204072 RepID=A0A4Z0BVC1_9BURK|nr:GntR family transcriptional regulator [Ramlibacter henchirensis]TFZ02801.1 GntR family transcriptional regulator [Ramlibacter henchirensis]